LLSQIANQRVARIIPKLNKASGIEACEPHPSSLL
jgi:hypothetical protein